MLIQSYVGRSGIFEEVETVGGEGGELERNQTKNLSWERSGCFLELLNTGKKPVLISIFLANRN